MASAFAAIQAPYVAAFLARRTSILELAGKLHLPMIYPLRDYVDSGGLMSLGPDLGELANALPSTCTRSQWGQAGRRRVLVNLKTAKALGLAIPGTLLVRADAVIE